MAEVALPKYFKRKRLKRVEDGRRVIAYYWERPVWANPPAERHGRQCTVESEALGTNLIDAMNKADMLNDMFRAWRLGIGDAAAKGTVFELFGWYRTLDRFTSKKFKTRRDYIANMAILEEFELKTTSFGRLSASEVEARHADHLYKALTKKRGARAGTYCMQVARRVWNEAIRHKKLKGPNPFGGMGLKTKAEKGNRATAREEYDLYRKTAHEMGFPSMALAAALAFELVRRVNDVFGFVFEGTADDAPAILWEDYRPGDRIVLRQGKTGDSQVIPLRAAVPRGNEAGAVGALLYPELEEELRIAGGGAGHMVVNEDTGRRYTEDQALKRFVKIRDKAGLPKDMTLTGFRHGGATELGDAGVYDIRAISGHRTLSQTATYNKATEAKAIRGAEKRRRHIAGVTDSDTHEDGE